MLSVELRFLAGRFHATPWGRNVNEGVVEWPPSPWRLARALFDVAKRQRPDWPSPRLAAVLRLLAGPPRFWLPPATASHTRSYLHSNTRDPSKRQKVLDAFVVVDRTESVFVSWDVDVPDEVRKDLADLLSRLDHLGRSEAWVRARITESLVEWNCVPLDEGTGARSAGRTEAVQVACVRPPGALGLEVWLEGLGVGTPELLDEGWSAPPAMLDVTYLRRDDALRPLPSVAAPPEHGFRFARYRLTSKVRPLLPDTLAVAERVRVSLMSQHKNVVGPDAISLALSGKAPDGGKAQGHVHAYYLPVDEDGDGILDHLLVRMSRPFDATELVALDRLRKVWQPNGRPDLELVLVGLTAESPSAIADTWESVTPFVTRRHHKRSRGSFASWIEQELRRECAHHGLPEPVAVTLRPEVSIRGRSLRWMSFIRGRKGSRPARGHGFEIRFAEPVQGPIALGALAHFGLGQFRPVA